MTRPVLRPTARALACLLLAAALPGCSPAEGARAREAGTPDRGDFTVVYEPVHTREYVEWQQELRKARVLEDVAASLNETFALPADVRLTFTECGEPNAFYDADDRRIRICYELMDDLYDTFEKHASSDEELDEAAWGAIYFTVYHELGHALVDLWDIPITGREEDAVDQLAAFLLTDGSPENESVAIDGANSFLLQDERSGGEIQEDALSDEHSLDPQRFYNIICWVYGHDPKEYAYLVRDGTLPKERAGVCRDEYARLYRSWSRLLAPYMKPRPKAHAAQAAQGKPAR